MYPIVWQVEHFDAIDSTNTYLAGKARDGAPEGTVALTDFQTAGRGRLDRAWQSPPRASLLCSILLRPELEVDHLQLVVAAVALAARAALVRLSGVRPQLKWPNDLVVGENKLAGVLAEVITTPSAVAIVVGLGINLTYEGPEGVAATSVLKESGVTIAPRALLDLVLEELESRRAQLNSREGHVVLRSEYERALSTIGRNVRVETLGDVICGEATGVDDTGRLVVVVGGTVRAVSMGDVVHVRLNESELE